MLLVNNSSSDTVVFHSGHRRGTLGAKEDKIAKVLNILEPCHPKMPTFQLGTSSMTGLVTGEGEGGSFTSFTPISNELSA